MGIRLLICVVDFKGAPVNFKGTPANWLLDWHQGNLSGQSRERDLMGKNLRGNSGMHVVVMSDRRG